MTGDGAVQQQQQQSPMRGGMRACPLLNTSFILTAPHSGLADRVVGRVVLVLKVQLGNQLVDIAEQRLGTRPRRSVAHVGTTTTKKKGSQSLLLQGQASTASLGLGLGLGLRLRLGLRLARLGKTLVVHLQVLVGASARVRAHVAVGGLELAALLALALGQGQLLHVQEARLPVGAARSAQRVRALLGRESAVEGSAQLDHMLGTAVNAQRSGA